MIDAILMAERDDSTGTPLGYLRVEGEGGYPVAQVRSLLAALEDSYQAAARIEVEAYRVLSFLEWDRFGGPSGVRYWPAIWFGAGGRDREPVAPGEPLIVSRVVLESPGFWEVLGSLSPLEVLRKYLNDRHERKKDRDYRSEAERERLAIQNAMGRLEVVERLAALEREYGPPVYSSNAWQRGWEAELRGPLQQLATNDDLGLIEGGSATSGPEPQAPGRD
jgi:hypothetical protein